MASTGVFADDTGVRAIGPDYSARFDGAGIEFTPLLGRAVETPATLRLSTQAIACGDHALWGRSTDLAPTIDGQRVVYTLADGIREVHEVRADGVEQSFVFDRRPPSAGDLVVRCRLSTGLPLVAATDDGARFVQGDAGGVSIGAVTGIDAHGVVRRGGLRVDGDVLELWLPASFVVAATYPLVLDPLIGAERTLVDTALPDTEPALAFDESTQRYLMVWHAETSATTAEVRAQFLTATGAPSGSSMLLSSNAVGAGRGPAVANINDRDAFVCVWTESAGPTRVAGYKVIAANSGAVTASGAIGAGVERVAAGGDARTPIFGSADGALVAYSTTTQVGAAIVRVSSTGSASVVDVGSLHAFPVSSDVFPAVSNQAGTVGRWLVVGSDGLSLKFALVAASGTVCHTGRIAGDAAWSTAVATPDGNDFLIAWDDANASQTVRLRRLTYASGCTGLAPSLGPATVSSAGASTRPSLTFAKDRYLLSWLEATGLVYSTACRTIGLDPGQYLGPTQFPGGSGRAGGLAVASRWSGGDIASDEGLVVWSHLASGSIHGRRIEATGSGAVLDLGGACGISGLNDFATYSGSPVLGTTLSIELAAPTAPVLALVLGFSTSPIPCGPCTIVPALDVVLPTSGPVPIAVPIDPNLAGASLYAQWVQWRPGGCPLFPDLGFSKTLQFVLSE